jgi:hypothetical protein
MSETDGGYEPWMGVGRGGAGGNAGVGGVGGMIGGGGGGGGHTVTFTPREYARDFMEAMDLSPTPDAISQLLEVFVPCLKIMCERPWDPNGGTWRKSGVLGILSDARKKFERLWERGWKRGKRHDDSGFDLINYVGFYLRSEDNRWGDWGEPAQIEDESE